MNHDYERKTQKIQPDIQGQRGRRGDTGRHTLAELSEKFEVSPVMISRWKKEFL